MRPQDGARNPWSAPTTELWAPTGCLPEHAVGMLSVARHLLDVPGVVIVLGVNHSELCHRVRSVHGAGCDAETYLRRFVDLPVDLGVVGTAQLDRFLNGRFEAAGIRDRFTSSEGWFLSEMIKLLAQQAGMSLQDIEQVVHRAALTLGSIAEPKSEAERAEDHRCGPGLESSGRLGIPGGRGHRHSRQPGREGGGRGFPQALPVPRRQRIQLLARRDLPQRLRHPGSRLQVPGEARRPRPRRYLGGLCRHGR